MKTTLFQYVSLTVVMLLLVVVVSMLPEQGALKNSLMDQTTAGNGSITAVQSKDNR